MPDDTKKKQYRLIGPDGKEYLSDRPGRIGGHRRLKIYGRLDCWSANMHLAKGNYRKHRVFFRDEQTAIAAGYRPCGNCMKEHHRDWKMGKLDKYPITISRDETRAGSPNGIPPLTVHLANGDTWSILNALLDPGLAENLELMEDCEGYRVMVDGPYVIVTLIAASGQWGRTIVWEPGDNRLVGIADTPFACASVMYKGKLVSLNLVAFWGHPAEFTYSVTTLDGPALQQPTQQGHLPIPVPDDPDPDITLTAERDGVEFCVGDERAVVKIEG